jgi:uncharacterized membrane protein YkoI
MTATTRGHRRLLACATSAVALAIALSIAGPARAGSVNEPPRWTKGSDFSQARDWNIRGENLVPHGINPLYYPIIPGHRQVHENPNHPDGFYRKETIVLPDLEPFDLPGIGRFMASVIQEEEYIDSVLMQRALNWYALDRVNNNLYVFGEVSWEINEEGKPVFAGTWRAGDPDGNGVAEPGLLMPGTVMLGARYIFDGSETMAWGGSEILETGLAYTVPAGTFNNCIRVREQGLLNLTDITDKVWCPVVGVVMDTSDGVLMLSAAIPGNDLSSFGALRDQRLPYTPPVAKIDGAEAQRIALGVFPGRVTSIKIERKRGHNVYTVEIMTANQGEKDVFVDIETGLVVGTD